MGTSGIPGSTREDRKSSTSASDTSTVPEPEGWVFEGGTNNSFGLIYNCRLPWGRGQSLGSSGGGYGETNVSGSM